MSGPLKTGFGVAVLAGGLALSAVAQKVTIPDAQVESNVLKALASAPELSTQNIQTTTVYGVVTLSGSASDEASRTKAENLVARVEGVKKVIDEMSIGGEQAQDGAAPVPSANGGDVALQGPPQGQPGVTYPGGNNPPYAPDANGQMQAAQSMPEGQGAQQPQGQQGPPPQQADGSAPTYSQPHLQRRPMYSAKVPRYDQMGGKQVTVPGGAVMQVRIIQGLSSHNLQPGTLFDGTLLNDVVADGVIAIPRGAAVQGVVVDAKSAGTLKGRGVVALQLTRLSLGGISYPLMSDTWARSGEDKTGHTVASAAGLGAVGAIFGAVVGGGAGAAIGAGVGAGAGVAASAASPNGQIVVPPEALLTFHLTQPALVTTVSQQEMGRLAYAAGGNGVAQPGQRRSPYPQPYYQPPAPYSPYYYPRY